MPRDKEWGLYGNVIECGKIADLKKLRLNRIDNILNYLIFIKEQSLLHIVFEYFKTIVTFYHFASINIYQKGVQFSYFVPLIMKIFGQLLSINRNTTNNVNARECGSTKLISHIYDKVIIFYCPCIP